MSVVAFACRAGLRAAPNRRATGLVAMALVATFLVASLIAPASALAIIPPVTFSDANLEAAVRNQLGIPSAPITQSDMSNLIVLNAGNAGISSLGGLEYANNLTTLQLYQNSISDITPLVGATSLQVLNISYNNISSLSPLSGITTLNWLNAGSNPITSLTPISGLTDLAYLDVNNCGLTTLSPISGLTNLSALMIYNNHTISDLTPLAGMTNLRTLYAGQNSVTDISPIASLTALETLDLSYQPISNLSPLVGLTNLTSLWLYSNSALVDISPLAALTQLEALNISTGNVFDISPLNGLAGANPDRIIIGGNWLDLTPGSETSQLIARLTARGYDVVTTTDQRSGGAILGTVSWPSGARISGVTVALTEGPRAFSAANGAYTIGLVRPGDRTLTFSKPYFFSQTVTLTVTAGVTETVNATLVPTKIAATIHRSPSSSSVTYKRRNGVARYTLSATLADARGPVRYAWIWLQKSGNGYSWTTAYRVKTNSLGKASVPLRDKKKRTVYYRWVAPATAYDYPASTSKQRVRIK